MDDLDSSRAAEDEAARKVVFMEPIKKIELASQMNPISEMKRGSGWVIALGVLLTIVGTFSAIYSVTATLATVLFVGWVFCFGAVFNLVQVFHSKSAGDVFTHLLVGVLYGVAGVYLISNPAINAVALTLLMGVVFVVNGIFRVISALLYRGPGTSWLVLNGLTTGLMGLLVLNQWPASGLWVIGLFVGIDLIMGGLYLIMFGRSARQRLSRLQATFA